MSDEAIKYVIFAVILVVAILVTWFLAIAYRKNVAEAKLGKAEDKAREIIDEALKAAEAKKRETLLEAKEEAMKTKNKIPMRQCTGCREMKSKKEMLRVLKTTEDEIVLDATGKKNGRGAYLCFSRECLDKAIKNHGLERSLKTAVPDEVYERLKKELEDIEK